VNFSRSDGFCVHTPTGAHGNERRRADAEFLGAQHRRDHHVTAGLDAAVDAQPHPMPEPVERQHLMDLRQAHLPGRAGIFDRGLRRRAGAAGMARDQDHVGIRLGDAGGDGADAGTRHQLHADRGIRIDLLEVVNELRQVLDRIDIVMRRRRNQGDARRGMAQPRDQPRYLDAEQLAAFAGLRALGHLDFDLAAIVQVFRGHAEPPGRDLLDRARRVVAVRFRLVARRVLAALAGIGPGADPVHRDRQGLVRLRRQRPQRDTGRDQPLADFGDRFDLVDADRFPLGIEIEQIPQIDRRQVANVFAVLLVDAVGVGLDGGLQTVDQLAVPKMRLAALAVAVEAADRQGRECVGKAALVNLDDLFLDTGEADTGNTAGQAGEKFRHEPA
jgi:hypothetical protein